MSRPGFLVVRWHTGLMSSALLISAVCTKEVNLLPGGCMDLRLIHNLLNQPVEWWVLLLFVLKSEVEIQGKLFICIEKWGLNSRKIIYFFKNNCHLPISLRLITWLWKSNNHTWTVYVQQWLTFAFGWLEKHSFFMYALVLDAQDFMVGNRWALVNSPSPQPCYRNSQTWKTLESWQVAKMIESENNSCPPLKQHFNLIHNIL